MISCVICGGSSFSLGPNGRKSDTGHLPFCINCHSLERHRIFFDIFSRFSSAEMRFFRCLQFSNDMTVRTDWFKSYELSIYGGENSLDLQKIEREDNSYDVVICNHVLEHVQDDSLALKEMLRIVSPYGFVFLSVPSPLKSHKTVEWSDPVMSQHGHFRVYGTDFIDRLKRVIPNAYKMVVVGLDIVTLTTDIVFFLCKDLSGVRFLEKHYSMLYTIE